MKLYETLYAESPERDIIMIDILFFIYSFPNDIIRSVENNYWRLIRIGENSLSLEFSGVCEQVSSPLESANIDEYYISSYHTGFCFVSYYYYPTFQP